MINAAFLVIGLWRTIFVAFFILLVVIVLLPPGARANAQNAGFGYTLKLIAGISTVMAAMIFTWAVLSALFFFLRRNRYELP